MILLQHISRLTGRLVAIALLGMLTACGGGSGSEQTDTYNSGRIRIAVDHSLRPVMESQVQVFEDAFPKAKIDVVYTSEAEAVQLLGQDSVRLIVIPRDITEAETKPLRDINIKPRSVLAAMDAVALIVHPTSPDTCLSVSDLQRLVRGEAMTWGQLRGTNRKDSIRAVVDDAGSSTIRYLLDSIAPGSQGLPRTFAATGSNPGVVEYVAQNPNALGLIGLAWLSDGDDSTTQVFLNKVRLVRIRQRNATGTGMGIDDGCVKPYQVHLLRNEYPLLRRVYLHSREARTGLGTAFIGFVTNEQGLRIFLKHDLLPGRSYIRTVELRTGQQP